jgi:3-hydroxyisobutyrate dehydrogenase-like beta-hydroxyacid dehydrogenase
MKEKIGIIGLGRMGMPTAKKLLNTGYPVIGYARRQEVVEELKSIGGEAAQDYKEVAQKAKTIIVFVLNDQQVIEVVTDENGALSGSGKDSTIICMSTINRENLEWVAKECRKKNVGFVDCPCTGGPQRIEKGNLILIAAAPRELLEKCRPILKLLGEIIRVGETPGMGQAVKHCNQLMVGVTLAATMETLTMAQKGGLDPRIVSEVIGKGAVGSDFFRIISSSVLDRKSSGGGLGQMCKDMDIVVNTSKRLKFPLLVGTSAYQYFLVAQSLGLEDQDNSQLIKAVERISDPGGLKSGN